MVQPQPDGRERDPDFYEEDELFKIEDDSITGAGSSRPSYLELAAGNVGSTPVSGRKPRFQFTG